jgi:hypothetical protein
MHDHQFAYATYSYAQFFCCFVLFRIIIHWYYKPSHLWEHLLLQVLLLFVFPELVIGLLIWRCEKLWKVYPPQDLSLPITWLLESLLLLALVIQVCEATILKESTDRELGYKSMELLQAIPPKPPPGAPGAHCRHFIPFPTPAFWYGAIILDIKPIFSTRLDSFGKRLGAGSICCSPARHGVGVAHTSLQCIFLGYSKTNLVG